MNKEKKKDIFRNFEYLKYEEINIKKAKENLQLIDKNNVYWIIPWIIKKYDESNNKKYFKEFIKILPSLISDKIKEEISKITDNKNNFF